MVLSVLISLLQLLQIYNVNSTQIFWVTTDNQLILRDNVREVSKKVCKVIGVFSEVRQYVPSTTLVTRYMP